jgi:predicted phosphate transport protein (TIGR00153 family)
MELRLFDLLLPREVAFFRYLNQQMDLLYRACESFKGLISQVKGMSHEEIHHYTAYIKEYESKEDEFERDIIVQLNKTFITPLDRGDIHDIVIGIGHTMDILNNVAQKIDKYRVTEVPENLTKFVDIMISVAGVLKKLIGSLETRKDLPALISRIHELEVEADTLTHSSMAELFQVKDPIYIIKFKDIYEHLEDVINSMDDIAKLIRGITLK